MSWAAVAVAGAGLVSGAMSADAQRKAGNRAAGAQGAAAQAGIDEQSRQFDAIRELLSPYVTAGQGALTGQQDLLGLNGGGAQSSAINGIASSPQFAALTQQGENAILANASATGGLRGGNVQGALAQFRPSMLSALIDQQYARLGGITSLGQNAAAGVGNAGMQTGMANANLMQQAGAAQAGGAMAQGAAQAGMWNSIGGAVGQFAGLGGFRGLGAGGATAGGGGVAGGGMKIPAGFTF